MINITLPVFDIEPSKNCIYDYIAVYNGPSLSDPLIGRLCGDQSPGTVTSSMNEIMLVFKSDAAKSFRGFKATYTSTSGGKRFV